VILCRFLYSTFLKKVTKTAFKLIYNYALKLLEFFGMYVSVLLIQTQFSTVVHLSRFIPCYFICI